MTTEPTCVAPETAAPATVEPRPVPERAQPERGPFPRRAALVVASPLLVSAAVVTVLVTCFRTAYLINDDASLTGLINGDYTGKRSASLVIAPAIFGHVVGMAYALLPHLPWYGITLYALQVVTWATIGAIVFTMRRRPPVAERLLVAAVLVALVPWMTLRLSYTPTSILLGVVGICVFAVAAKVPGRRGTMYALLAGMLLGSAFLVRSSSFFGVVIAFAPVLVLIAVKSGPRRSAVFAVVIGVLVLVGLGTNRVEYSRSAEWRAFVKMNAARSGLHDTPRLLSANVSQKTLNRIGWTRNDLWLFGDFLYPDPAVYSDQDIRTLASESPYVRRDLSARYVFDRLAHDSSDRNGDRGPILASLVLVGAVLVLRWNRAAALATLVSAVWFVGVLVVLMLYVRLPGRVFIPLEAGAILLAAIVPAYLSSTLPRTSIRWPWASTVAAVLVALLVAGTVWHGVRNTPRISRENSAAAKLQTVLSDTLTAFDPEGVFVARGDIFGRSADPLTASSPFANPRIIPLGWATNSPLLTARLARVGIDDLYTALQTRSHTYFIGSIIEARRVARYYREHRGIAVAFKRAGPKFLGGLFVWSSARSPAPLNHG